MFLVSQILKGTKKVIRNKNVYNTIRAKTQLGRKFLIGTEHEFSFLSLAGSVQRSINYYRNVRDDEKMYAYIDGVEAIVNPSITELKSVHAKLKSKAESIGKIPEQMFGLVNVTFKIDHALVKQIISIGMLADESFMLVQHLKSIDALQSGQEKKMLNARIMKAANDFIDALKKLEMADRRDRPNLI